MKKKFLAVVAAAATAVAMMPGMAFAAEETTDSTDAGEYTIDIPVEKKWEDGDNKDELRPDDISLTLKDEQGNDAGNVTLTEDGWSGSFTDVDPYNQDGSLKTFTVEEEAVDGYESECSELTLTVDSNVSEWEKTPNCNKEMYDIGSANIVLGKMVEHGLPTKYIIWTKSNTEGQHDAIISGINSNKPDGLGGGKDGLTTNNTTFIFGNGAVYNGSNGNTTIQSKNDSSNYQITFDRTNVWAMFWTGLMNVLAGDGFTVTNTHYGTPVDPVDPTDPTDPTDPEYNDPNDPKVPIDEPVFNDPENPEDAPMYKDSANPEVKIQKTTAKAVVDDNVKTGDNFNILLMAGIALAAVIAGLGVLFVRRQK